MKNQINARSAQTSASAVMPRSAGHRLHLAKTVVHRHERRKIREQLRRVDWAPGLEDDVFA